ncbi:hypothetical protein [Actinomadura roseirufa]|uniref:hypothetical protein n=1 Tax=Actinomadura roseirufa TaxID=2094049 RepID=UPI00104139BC|nr:hypothetical protein [Actinomadura roseirufa]
MRRKLPDLSTTQLIASGVATLAAAVGASYLGVYGTILGAAFMSVASTAGSTVCKHYLDQGRAQIKDLTHLQAAEQRREAAREAGADARSPDPTRAVAWPAGDPNATRLDLPLPGGGDPNATRLDRTPAETVAEALAQEAGAEAVREVVRRSALQNTVEWAKRNWVKLVVSSAAVFAIVIGGITLYEATTGTPIGNAQSKGLTVTKVLGGDGGGTSDRRPESPSTHRTEPGASPSGEPSGEVPSTGSSTHPEEGTTGRPSDRPTTGTPTTPTEPTKPDTPTPTKSTGGEGATPNGQGGTETGPRTAPTE